MLLVHWLVFFLEVPWHAVAMVTVCVVYINVWMMRSHLMDSTCGYMCACALALLTQPLKQRCPESASVMLWFEDLAWSFVATFEVVGSVSCIFVPLQFALKILIGGALAVFHVLGSCASTGALEMVLRAVLFYGMCAVCVLCLKFTNVREAERKNYTSMIPHACMHVFYVHLYAALAGAPFMVRRPSACGRTASGWTSMAGLRTRPGLRVPGVRPPAVRLVHLLHHVYHGRRVGIRSQ